MKPDDKILRRVVLNGLIAGLPKWPTIELVERPNRYQILVHGLYVSYPWLMLSKWLLRFIVGSYFYFLIKSLHETDAGSAVLTLSVQAVVCLLIFAVFPLGRWLCWLVFRTRTYVIFEPSFVRISETPLSSPEYDITGMVSPQFRAIRPARMWVPDIQGPDRHLEYDRSFRIVEMVYGARLARVAAMPGEKADYFALALQIAHDLIRSPQSSWGMSERVGGVSAAGLPE